MNKHDRMNEQIKKHGDNLKTIFNLTDHSGDWFARKVHRLEYQAHKLAENYCNGENGVDSENWEEKSDKILDQLDKILNFRAQNVPVFFNADARGYALKIDDKYIRDNNLNIHTDWGGYGILAPDLNGN